MNTFNNQLAEIQHIINKIDEIGNKIPSSAKECIEINSELQIQYIYLEAASKVLANMAKRYIK